MKVIPGEFQHAIVVAYIDKMKIRNVLRNTCAESLLEDVIRKYFQEKVIELLMKLVCQICGYILWMRFYGHVMRFVVRRVVGEAKEIHGGGMKR